jgi:hypothetical protein
MRDVPTMTPRVNEPYPTSEALATFPPLLLQSLPRLAAQIGVEDCPLADRDSGISNA